MSHVVGVDIGGTFTDCVAVSSDGQVRIGKSSSTPPDFDRGFMDAIGVLAERAGQSVREFLADTDELLHGCTVGTNALVEGRTARVALITSAGHTEPFYVMRAGGRLSGQSPDFIAHVAAHTKPEPLVPRNLVREVNERVTRDGSVLVQLNDDEVREVVRDLLDGGVDAFAVSLLWSVTNDLHERRIGAIIEEMAPGTFVSLASEMVNRIGEYERTVAAVVNSLIGPAMRSYLTSLRESLAQEGYTREVGIMTCSGGLVDSAMAQRRPLLTIGSGPVAGVVGAQVLSGRQAEAGAVAGISAEVGNVITADMGGTTLDVGVLERSTPLTRATTRYGQYEYFVPTLDVRSVGAGGGSIIRYDELSGTIRVGPQSAGANPGPAAFGRGGTQATVTDADLVLGYLNPEYFLQGGMGLDMDAARAALARVGEPLGLSAEETAAAGVRIVDNHMADEIRLLSIHQGHDARRFSLYAYGGNGAVHATAFAEQLGMSRVVVPLGDLASGFSALGVAASEQLVVEEATAMVAYPFDLDRLNGMWTRLEGSAWDRMVAQGVKESELEIERFVEMRYSQQISEVQIQVPTGQYTQETSDRIVGDFEREYARVYGEGSGYAKAGYTIKTIIVKAKGKARELALSVTGTGLSGTPPLKGERGIIWYERGLERVATPIYDGSGFHAGMSLTGPAIVEYPDTTLVVRPGQVAGLDATNSVVVDIEQKEAQR
jgi:N-methylhydantoinase A